MNLTHKINFAVVGSRRGFTFMNSARALHERVHLMAVCDVSEEALKP